MIEAFLPEKFLARVGIRSTDECWYWRGSICPKGYGRYWEGNKNNKPHRYSYEKIVGLIPDGLVIDHLCRNRDCVNPFHLEPVTNRENCIRGNTGKHMRDKTHCKQGHILGGENLYMSPNGARNCRVCRSSATKRYLVRRAFR